MSTPTINFDFMSVLFWLNKAKSDSKGFAPLYARITVRGKRAELSLQKKINPEKWDAKSGFMKGSNDEARQINKFIVEVSNDLFIIQRYHKTEERLITADGIKDAYLGKHEIHRTLLEVFKEHNDNVEALIGKGFVKATHTKYSTIRDKVEAFIKHKYKKQDLLLESLEYSFILNFEIFLKVNESIAHNTAMSYIKRVKKIITIAVNNRWIAYNPFAGFVCVMKKVERTELDEFELERLEEKELRNIRLDEVRDCFLFSCYTGYAFVDAFKLGPEHLTNGKDGELWINTTRTKSAITANVPLMPKALAIIEKYKEHECRLISNKLLPMKSNQKMNAYLKEIAVLCDIDKELTTHMARHTFATTVTLENDVPIESVSKMLGHTKITTTQLYARVKEKKVSRDMKILKSKFINKTIP